MNIKKLIIIVLFILLLGIGCKQNNNTNTKCQHEIVSFESKEATCTKEGNLEYYYCTKCNKYYIDKELTIETTYEELIINKTNHIESDWIVDIEATCDKQGLKHKECTICKEKLQEKSISTPAHNYNTGNIVLLDNGNKAVTRYNCSNCTNYKDEIYSGYYLLNDEVYDFDNTGSRINIDKSLIEVNDSKYYVINNLIQKNKYVVYEQNIYYFGEDGKAIVDTTYEGYIFDDDGHLMPGVLIKIDGKLYYVNNDNATIHEHIIEHNSYKGATCTENGNIEYYYCTICNRYYKDSSYTKEITYIDTIINASHTLTDWIIDTEATCTKTGSKHKECSVCKNTIETETIDAIGHNYVDNKCTRCNFIKIEVGDKEILIESKYVYFGEYPQTLKEESVTIGNRKDSDGYYLGSDGERYDKVIANPNSGVYTLYFNNNTEIVEGEIYYFKVEPIKWKIEEQSNGTYKLISDLIIDCQKYNSSIEDRKIGGETIYANNYKYSDIRIWLNKKFIEKAFTYELQKYIKTIEVDNSVSSKYACENTMDKIYLPSYQEIETSAYGSGYYSYTRTQKQITDYAKAMGCFTTSNYHNNGKYWLRSPDYYFSNYAYIVGYSGQACTYNYNWNSVGDVSTDSYGVAPALTIQID